MVMGGAVLILFLLPWLDRSPVRRSATAACCRSC
jgi:quinol-cytochrome oxidoreductase complex cytochrome b subunit